MSDSIDPTDSASDADSLSEGDAATTPASTAAPSVIRGRTVPSIGAAWLPALERPDLLAAPTARGLDRWAEGVPAVATEVLAAPIDPDLADTDALNERYALPADLCGNCVLIGGSRGGVHRVAGALVRADANVDVNHVVRKLLDVRKASFLPQAEAVEASGQEYGGIGPIGLPEGWRVLLDAGIAGSDDLVLIGSGVRASKLVLPGSLLATYPGVEAIEGLGTR